MSKRRSTDGGDSLNANPFAGLESTGLRAAPPTRPEPKKGEGKKRFRGRIEVRREKAGRGGKTVTTLRGFLTGESDRELEALTFDLKKACASGGTLKGRVIELQGDVRAKVSVELEKRNYQPVLAGG